MNNPIRKNLLYTLLVFGFSMSTSYGQIFEGNAYAIGTAVEIAVHGDGGHEGTADWPGNHARGGSEDVPFGFVANPFMDGWVDYDGDFFTAGTPENGFGLEFNGSTYSNNAWNSESLTAYLQEIPTAPGGNITHVNDDGCITIEWEGIVAGVTINVKYHLRETDLFYTTEITLYNGSGSTINDLYYYRNVDPDNNEPLGATFTTTNTIVQQADEDCKKALVSAEQGTPWASYLGLGALGDNFRVSHGGFSNRSGSDIWNGVGLNSTTGDVETADEAISLAYKTNLAAGQTVNFTYAVILSESQLGLAFQSLYGIDFFTTNGLTGSSTYCNPTEVNLDCGGMDSVLLVVNGPNTEDYDWYWPTLDMTNDSVYVLPDIGGLHTVIGSPLSDCVSEVVSLNIYISIVGGPSIEVFDPGLICGEFDINLLEYIDHDGSESTVCVFLTEEPTEPGQTEPAFEGPMVGSGDEVWLSCYDSVTNCFDYVEIDLNFVGPGLAGLDSTITLCGGIGVVIDLSEMVTDTANQDGVFEEWIFSGRLDDSTGVFNASDLYGTFNFWYIIPGLDTCQSDTAVFTVNLLPPPTARFSYEVNEVSSDDGLISTCIVNEIDFTNLSFVDPPGEIVSWGWTFGDGETSDEWEPSHIYENPGNYVIVLYVESDNGCLSSYARQIEIYTEPEMEVSSASPLCFDYTDGFIKVDVDETVGGPLTIDITDEAGVSLNGGADSLGGLGEGTYYIIVEDASGCTAIDSVTLIEPPLLFMYYHIVHPPCTGDSGYVVVDSVVGESLNNPVSFEWDPNPAGISGFDADSSYWMVAGDYTVTATDSKGCTNSVDITLIDPPPFYFTEWGWDTAYCRLYNFQSGNGIVYAAVAGGVPNYTYEWTYLVDGTTSDNTTWGGRNPGDHRIRVTDAFGCVLTKIVTVDSVNPIASFTTSSNVLNDSCQGTADVPVEFTNTSQYYANPNNPIADTTFFWDLDRTYEDDWMISHDINETFDTVYKARGYTYDVNVCLIAFNKNGCSDTACKVITIWEPPELSAPNIFSPNDNATNDLFSFDKFAKGIGEFNCIIVNRWGVKVAEFSGIENGWDGMDMNGDICPDGVYYYTYTAVADNGTEFSGHGHLTLIGSGRQ